MIGVAWYDQAHDGHASTIVGALLAALGIDVLGVGVNWAQAAASLAVLLGVGDRVRKAVIQRRAGVPARQLLTARLGGRVVEVAAERWGEQDDPRRVLLRVNLSENPHDSPAAHARVRRALIEAVDRHLAGLPPRA